MAYDDLIESAAQSQNIDPALIRAVIQTESGGNPKAVSSKGAVGLGQLMPATAKSLGVSDPTDPKQAIPAIAALLNENLTRYGNVQDALRAYHGGTDQKNWGQLTQAYPQKVLNNMAKGQSAMPQTLPGIPTSKSQDAQSDDAIFAAFSGGVRPVANQTKAQQSQNGPTDDQIMAAFMQSPQNNQSTSPSKKVAPQQPSTSPSTSAVSDFLQAAGHHMVAPIHGLAQLIEHGINSGIQSLAPGTDLANYAQRTVNADDAAIRNWEAQYQKSTPNSIPAYAGATAGEIIPAVVGGGASLMAKGSELGGQIAARLGLRGAGSAIARGTGTAAGGAGLGAIYSSAQPVTSQGDYLGQKAAQVETGAVLGAVTPAIGNALGQSASYAGNVLGSLARPFTKSGRSEIAQNIISQAAEGGPTSLNLSQIVPGSVPTLAEATANPGIATLQRTIRDLNPSPFVAQEQQNAAARLVQLGNVVGTPADIATSKAAAEQSAANISRAILDNNVAVTPELHDVLSRPAMASVVRDAEKAAQNLPGAVNPFQEARNAVTAQRTAQLQGITGTPRDLESAIASRDSAASPLYEQANNQTFQANKALNTLMDRPSMKQAVARAQKLASERGEPLKEGIDLPAKSSESMIVDINGNPAFTTTTPSQQSSYSGRALNYIKMALDDILGSGSQTGGIVGHEKSALTQTKNQFLDWMDSQSDVYKQARKTYAQGSEPVNAMDYLQSLNLTDAAGNIVPGKVDSAIKSITSAQAEKGVNQAKSITTVQLNQLKALRDSLLRDKSAPIPPNLGPNAIAHIQDAITSRLTSNSALTPELITSLNDAQKAIMSELEKQNPNSIGARPPIPGSAAEKFTGPMTLPQQAQFQASAKDAAEAIQGLNLTDAQGNVTLAKVQNALKSIKKQGISADPKKIAILESIRDDLLRASNTGLGRSAGSSTAQNLATQQMLRAALPGKLGMLASQLPSGAIGGGIGTALGYGAAGPIGAATGGFIGSKVGSGLSALMNTKNEAIQREIEQLLLNPSVAAPALKRASSGALPLAPAGALQRLMYPSFIGSGVGLLNSGSTMRRIPE